SRTCGNSSVGRAQPCQGWGREFESRFPLQILKEAIARSLFSFLLPQKISTDSEIPQVPTALQLADLPAEPRRVRKASISPFTRSGSVTGAMCPSPEKSTRRTLGRVSVSRRVTASDETGECWPASSNTG